MTEHEPAESARPSLDRRDAPDALRPDADDEAPHRTLPAEDAEPEDAEGEDAEREDAEREDPEDG